jgi:hypothetical protein
MAQAGLKILRMIAHFDKVIRNAKQGRMAADMNIPYVTTEE